MATFNFSRIFVLFAAVTLAAASLVLVEPLGRPARAQVISPQATLVRAGDIASCSHNRDYQTARLLDGTIATANAPVTVFNLGTTSTRMAPPRSSATATTPHGEGATWVNART